MNSLTLWIGSFGLTTRMAGTLAMNEIGAKLVSGS